MVCNLTIGKKGYEEAEERMRWMLRAGREVARTEFLDLADRDATAFDGVMAAFKMPKETDAEKAVRSAAIQAGLRVRRDGPARDRQARGRPDGARARDHRDRQRAGRVRRRVRGAGAVVGRVVRDLQRQRSTRRR